jgi:GalNAc-alpha-(1->4)-GalNAc-alpha-(1->3)-diNAcBac-PP-undecaprenol alpha-1,4-N-acetyl-D-galactosaminyltransferase
MYLFAVNRLTGGGAERNLVRIAECMRDRGNTVHLVVLQDEEIEDIEPTPSIIIHRLHLNRTGTGLSKILSHMRHLHKIRKLARQLSPSLIVTFCFRTNLLILEATAFLNIPVVVSERSNPHLQHETCFEQLRRRISYPSAAKVVLLAEELESWASAFSPKWSVVSIPNFVPEPPEKQPLRRNGSKRLLAMGRFVHAKGFDLLVKVFSELAKSYPEWKLTIVGDGPLRGELERLIHELGILDEVELPGWSTDPYSWYFRSDIFAFPSRFEGFGMTLAEALSCRLPVVAFDCPYGPSRIVSNHVNGFLVEPGHIDEFKNRLAKLMKDSELRRKMGESGPIVLTKYGIRGVMDQWESLLKSIEVVS